MKTLVVYYSKTGNTKKAAEAVIKALDCDSDEIIFNEKDRTIQCGYSPLEYERVILLSPVWAFSLSEPMKRYLSKYGGSIKKYSLIVTCSRVGLRGCVRNCKSTIGKAPESALKIKAKNIASGNFDVTPAVRN